MNCRKYPETKFKFRFWQASNLLDCTRQGELEIGLAGGICPREKILLFLHLAKIHRYGHFTRRIRTSRSFDAKSALAFFGWVDTVSK